MVLAKPARMKPRDIADKLAAKLRRRSGIAKRRGGRARLPQPHADSPRSGTALVRAHPRRGRRLRPLDVGHGETVNVEYVSANPTGPMHVGHCRGAVFGDALANLLAFAGYDVTREYYINDAGGQVDVLARSAYLRYREALGEDIGEIPQGLYPGDYLKPVGEALAKEHGKSLLNMPEERVAAARARRRHRAMLAMIKDDLAALNIRHDVFFSERSLTKGGTDKIKAGRSTRCAGKGLVYEGRLREAQGPRRRGVGGPRADAVQVDRRSATTPTAR